MLEQADQALLTSIVRDLDMPSLCILAMALIVANDWEQLTPPPQTSEQLTPPPQTSEQQELVE